MSALSTALAILRLSNDVIDVLLRIGELLECGDHDGAISEIEIAKQKAAGEAGWRASRAASSGAR